jgi:lipopolysaccharide exporter
MADPTGPPDRPTTELTRHTLAGLQWTYLSVAIGAVLQFGMTAVLARLLTPTAFGLVALAGLFLRFVNYFAKGGILQALIQKTELSDDDVRASFTLSAGLSIAFAVLVLLGAPLAGQIAQDPDLVPVLRWLALSLLLQGFAAPSAAILRRGMRFRYLATVDIGSYVAGYVLVGLSLAMAGAGVYALVGAMLVQGATYAVSCYVAVRHSIIPSRSKASYQSILAFGARMSVIGFFEFLQSDLDTLAVGRWAGTAPLGLYNRAKMIAELPSYQLTSGLSGVLFPSFSAIQLDRDRLTRAYLSAIGAAAAIVLPLNAGMAVAAPELVLVLLGPQWVGAIEVIPWLLLAATFSLLGHFGGTVAEAQAALNAKLLVAIITTAILAGLLFVARGQDLWVYGAAVAIAAAVSHAGYVTILTRTLRTGYRTLMAPYARSLAGAAVVAGAVAGCRQSLTLLAAPIPLVLAAEVLTGAVTLLILLVYGPLRPFRAEFASRLTTAGIVADDATGWRRALRRVVGTPLSDPFV